MHLCALDAVGTRSEPDRVRPPGAGLFKTAGIDTSLASAAWDKGIAPAVPEVLLVDGIRWGSVGPLVLISLAIMGSPGPATISLMAAGSAYGVRRSLSYLIGIIVGTTIVLLAVATGITAALLAVPAIGSVLIWISAAYILWLAYHIATAPPLSEPTAASSTFLRSRGNFPRHRQPEGLGRHRRGLRQRPPRRRHGNGRCRQNRGADRDDHCDLRDMARRRTPIAPLLRDPGRARVVNAALAVALVGATALAVLH